MSFKPKNTENTMKKKKLEDTFLPQEGKNSIRTDLQNIQSLKTDQIVSYRSLNKVNTSIIKKGKEIAELFCS